MTIATNSVLRRILDEARHEPVPDETMPSHRFRAADRILEVRETEHGGEAPFATSLHFWAHALRAFLDGQGRADAFDALAVNCLCKTLPGDAVSPAIAPLLEGFDAAGPAREVCAGPFDQGHLMIEQDVLISWVTERARRFVALFWVEPGWLQHARPIPRE